MIASIGSSREEISHDPELKVSLIPKYYYYSKERIIFVIVFWNKQ
jgi:hypothetical protein